MGIRFFVCLAAALAASGAQAAGVGLRMGTTGVGGDVGWSLAPTLSARVGYSGLNWSQDFSSDGQRFEGKLRLANFSGLLDFSPAGPFRITSGLYYHNNRYTVTAQPDNGVFRINDNTYAAGSGVSGIEGRVEARRRLAPYFGIGWGNVAGAGVNFYADLGVILHGKPKARLTATCGPALSAAQCAQLQADTAAEQARVEDNLRAFRYYPVLNIGLTVGF